MQGPCPVCMLYTTRYDQIKNFLRRIDTPQSNTANYIVARKAYKMYSDIIANAQQRDTHFHSINITAFKHHIDHCNMSARKANHRDVNVCIQIQTKLQENIQTILGDDNWITDDAKKENLEFLTRLHANWLEQRRRAYGMISRDETQS